MVKNWVRLHDAPGICQLAVHWVRESARFLGVHTMKYMKLLLVEDDVVMRSALERTLSRRGFLIQACDDGLAALQKWRTMRFDVILLDLTLPGMDGLQVLAEARQSGLSTPVLIATARGTVGDRIMGLNLGADDYLPKPFDLDELEARLRALVRRRAIEASNPDELDDFGHFQLGALRYEKSSGAIYRADQPMDLTPRERTLLQALLLKHGHAVAKEKLFEVVFPGQTDLQPDAIEVVVYRLRKKLLHCGVTIMTLRGLGYLIKASL